MTVFTGLPMTLAKQRVYHSPVQGKRF